jgi:hypothetical protein
VIKATLALCAIAAVGAALALTGAGASPSVGPQGPTVDSLPKVTPAVFRGSVHDLPQLGLEKSQRPKPRPWEHENLVPSGPKASLPGAVQPPEAQAVASAPVPSPSSSFNGLDSQNWGAGWPPDTNGDVGPAYFVQAVNTSIGIFRKSDGVRVSAFTFNALWSSAHSGTACDNANQGDPTVVYDPLGDRWIVADFGMASFNTGPFYECIAVSRTGDPVNGGWYFYAVRADDAAHPWFPDYPKMGIWPDGLYMSANMFQGNTYREVRVWAFNRSDLESGAPLRSVVADTNSTSYFSLLPGNMRSAAGAPPAGSPNYLVSESQSAYAFEVWKFHADYSGSGSTFSGPANVSQATYNATGGNVPSPGNQLDSLYDRLMNQAQYSNIGGKESLWVNHTVRCCGTSSSPMGVQWAQLDVTGGTVAANPVQQQIYPGSNDGVGRWMGSVAVDKLGDLALGYSASSSTLNPDIRYAGRLSTDPLGTMPLTEASLLSGVTRGSQTNSCGGALCTRWGDYSAMVLDPNGCDFWYTQEYYGVSGGNWQTRIGSFRLNPSCGSSGGGTQSQTISFGPLTGKTYGDADFTVSATASSGLPVSFSATDNCTASGSTVHLNGAGSCTITASQSGDSTYAPAADVSQTFAIARGSQAITFAALADKTYGDPDFTLSATASSGLPVSFAATGNCTVSGSTVHLTSAGSCTITASQAGNANYTAAADVQRSFTINPAPPGTPLSITSTTGGTLGFSSGAWVNGGWHVKLSTRNNSPVTVQLTGTVDLPVSCPSGGGTGGTISVPVSTTVTIPARSTSYVPTSDQTSSLGWLGAVQASALCGGNAMRNTSATLNATVQSSAHSGQLTFQFHFRVPAASGGTNANCTTYQATSKRDSTCTASWSTSTSI